MLLTTLCMLIGPSLVFGQGSPSMLDSLKREFMGASTVDSAYIAEKIAKECRVQGDATNCLEYAHMTFRLAEKIKDTSLLASSNNILGTVYLLNNNLDVAYQYLDEAQKLYTQIGDTLWQTKTLNNIALFYWKKKEFEAAKVRFQQIANTLNEVYLEQSPENLEIFRAVTYFNLGLMHFELKDHLPALEYFHQSDALMPPIKSRLDSVRKLQLSVRLAQCYFEMGNHDKALSYVERGNALNLFNGVEDHMLRLADVEKMILLAQGKTAQLIQKNREFEDIKDAYFDVERHKEILNLNKKFEAEKRIQKQKMLEKELERQNMVDILLVSLLIFISIISINLYRSLRARRKANEVLKEQTLALQIAKTEAEKASKAKDEFLSMMSHEMRTPLNGVIGMTEILKSENPRPRQKENLNILKSSANHLLALINDVLDYNRAETNNLSLEKNNFNLKHTVDNLCKALLPEANSKRLHLSWHFDEKLSEFVIGDPVRISQVLNNLISNAIKFTDEGKVEINITQSVEGKYKFEVKDTGIGIAPDKHSEIFERFRQLTTKNSQNYGGTGLGLSISQRFVKLMGGELQLESEPGEGSTFFFSISLPAGQRPFLIPTDSIDNHVRELKGYHILLAEDNPVNQLVAKKFLSKWGAQITIAIDGAEAVEKVAKNSFDAILMDIQMPKMDGLEATQKIRQAENEGIRTIPIIALTASVVNKEDDWAEKNGFDAFVYKPFKPEQLLEHIKLICPSPRRLP